MSQDNVFAFNKPETTEDPLTALPRAGAKRLIQQAVEVELSELWRCTPAPQTRTGATRGAQRLPAGA